ncbi:PepSY domain-containing protein [Paraburkholderia sp. DHOC27]|uniref:PepSY-associated TM helix domain-containing protein n=1 Tax=Paraburkholderia sp. DHOC27 TaxID=2303330 RepID=UPI000E3CF7B5|nr:PepSY-associated TM helix domain-containing protein [Paraburkholderia sp. DHOC27]RFU45380.1 PepSY domain-containing protein [Paraburkholderia sp. DHOC27]
MRPVLVRLHRWFGIGTALFLFMSGLTGSIIAWNEELDALLNPDFYHARSNAPALSSLELANRVEAADPRVRVTYLPLGVAPGRTLQIRVASRINPATHQPYALDFNQLAIDPGTGVVQGRREWGALSVKRLNLLPFIYQLHYTLFLPTTGNGIATGVWLMGVVGIVWLFDSVIALVLAFPSFRTWRKSFTFRVQRGGYPLVFDLHRSGGVWVWGLLAVIATTSISMNLEAPVVRPIVSFFSTLAPDAASNPELRATSNPPAPMLSRERMVALAAATGRDLKLDEPPGAIFEFEGLHLFGVGFFQPGDNVVRSGLGTAWLYWDGRNGQRVGSSIPGEGSAGDIFLQAQFPLHSGRIIGLAGRIMISAMGLIVAMLSATGLVIWIRKLKARRSAAQRATSGRLAKS